MLLSPSPDGFWTALMIGNSSLHFAVFQGQNLQNRWDHPHLIPTDSPSSLLPESLKDCPLVVASVVPQQTQFWHSLPTVKEITLGDIPLKYLYPTMGCDRALALYGALKTRGLPVLVIDAGTAITLSAACPPDQFQGGSILPSLYLQQRSLTQYTAMLPEVSFPSKLPPRWSFNTPDAIASGILYTLLGGLSASIQDWWSQSPNSPVILTGGDGKRLFNYLSEFLSQGGHLLEFDPDLIFQGIATREQGS